MQRRREAARLEMMQLAKNERKGKHGKERIGGEMADLAALPDRSEKQVAKGAAIGREMAAEQHIERGKGMLNGRRAMRYERKRRRRILSG